MRITYLLPALLFASSFATQAATDRRANEVSSRVHLGTRPAIERRLQVYVEGREVVAPPWSFACANDQGLRQCREPMWVYGSPDYLAQFENAF
jgi:hypothetical protein